MKNNLVTAPFPNIFGDLQEFIKYGAPDIQSFPFQRPSEKAITLGINLITEEVTKELLSDLEILKSQGYSIELMARIMNHLVDSVYVLTWTAVAFGLPFNEEWESVHDNNMTKFPLHNPEVCMGKDCEFQWLGDFEYDGGIVKAKTACNAGRLVTIRLPDGKVLKPKTWKEPDSFGLLYRHWGRMLQMKIDEQAQLPQTERKGFQQLDHGQEIKGVNSDLKLKPKENNGNIPTTSEGSGTGTGGEKE